MEVVISLSFDIAYIMENTANTFITNTQPD